MGKGPVNLGIAGIGRAGYGMFTEELKGKESMFRIVAAWDVMEQRRALMQEHCGCAAYERIEDLIAEPQVELVAIATRSCDHFAHAKMVLESGKDCLVEKPMTTTHQEAETLVRVAADSGARLFVRHNRRFERGFQHIREIIASGLLGEVFEIKLRRMSYARRDDWQTLIEFGGGQLLNWGPHVIDHALRLLESPVRSIWSDIKRVAAVGDAEDHVRIMLTGENGRVVDIGISGGAAIGEQVYLVWGTRGALSCDDKTIALRYLDPNQPLAERHANPETPGLDNFGTPETLGWINETIPVNPRGNVNLSTIWDALYATIREGKPFPITLDEALEVMRVISTVKASTQFDK